MKHRLKRTNVNSDDIKSKLLFVVRIRGLRDMHSKTQQILNRVRLPHILSGVFLKATESNLKMLLAVEPFVTFGYPNLKSEGINLQKRLWKNRKGKCSSH